LDTISGLTDGAYDELDDFYYTFVDLLEYKQITKAVMEELTGAVATFKVSAILWRGKKEENLITAQFDRNPVLTEAFLDLTTTLIRALLLMASIADRRALVSVFAGLYAKRNGSEEGTWRPYVLPHAQTTLV
jgi:hypothetical protein